ncbi:sigma factor [Paenibacillus lautus]|uniref:sigma factor n=1 Tax=Paenibacillus lautus TaxID=1401 RepID=UPI003D297236
MECISTRRRNEPLVTSPFNESITQLLPDLRSYCMQLAFGSKWDAEDIVQESLIKVHHARDVQRSGETLSFTFRDPDGHLLTFTTNIFLSPVSFAPSSSVK